MRNYNLEGITELPDVYVLKSLVSVEDLPSWGNFFDAANAAAVRRDTDLRVGNPMAERQINDLVTMGLSYMYYYMTEEERETSFKGLMPLQQALHQAFPRKYRHFNLSTAFLTILNEDAQAGPHADNTHNLYVQCQGAVDWYIHQDDENYSWLGTYHLEPGDGIFVASGVLHSVKATTARAGVTFRLDVEDSLEDVS